MLTRLSVKGFKTLVDFDVPLSKVTVLVGPNNCGKSNVLKALDYLSRVVRAGPVEAENGLGGLDALTTRGVTAPLEIRVWARLAEWSFEYYFRARGQFEAGSEQLLVNGPSRIEFIWAASGSKLHVDGKGVSHINAGSPGELLKACTYVKEAPECVRDFYRFVAGMAVADISPSALREPSQIVPHPELDPSGRGLAALLDHLDGSRPLVRAQIDKEVHEAIPRVTRVITVPVARAGFKTLGVAEGREAFRAEHVSDGILLFIALSTITQMSGGNTLVGLEEPDKGIHPRRIRDLLDQVYRLANAGSQFILTTHSPVLLNEFRDYPESVLILDRDDSGTHSRQLSALPDVEAQLKDVQLGDLWYSGVLGGVPQR